MAGKFRGIKLLWINFLLKPLFILEDHKIFSHAVCDSEKGRNTVGLRKIGLCELINY